MVAAGCSIALDVPVFEGVPSAMNVIAFTGAFASGAQQRTTQNDIVSSYLHHFQPVCHGNGTGVGATRRAIHPMTHVTLKQCCSGFWFW